MAFIVATLLARLAEASWERWMPRGGLIGLGGLAAYFGLSFLPNWWPAIGGTTWFIVYAASLPLMLVVLVALAIWGIDEALSRPRGSPVAPRARALLVVSSAGLLMFACAIVLGMATFWSFPLGSHLREFDSAIWKQTGSSDLRGGYLSARQKMLASLIGQLGPGQSRAEIEALLGPAVETPYFENTGRNLVYHLGPERWPLGLDSEWLLIEFDDSGSFERYEIAED